MNSSSLPSSSRLSTFVNVVDKILEAWESIKRERTIGIVYNDDDIILSEECRQRIAALVDYIDSLVNDFSVGDSYLETMLSLLVQTESMRVVNEFESISPYCMYSWRDDVLSTHMDYNPAMIVHLKMARDVANGNADAYQFSTHKRDRYVFLLSSYMSLLRDNSEQARVIASLTKAVSALQKDIGSILEVILEYDTEVDSVRSSGKPPVSQLATKKRTASTQTRQIHLREQLSRLLRGRSLAE